MLPLRLVIDTNVLVSAALNPDGLQRTTILIAITKPARLYVSPPILEEYAGVLARPHLKIRKGVRLQLLQLIKNYKNLHAKAHWVGYSPRMANAICNRGNVIADCVAHFLRQEISFGKLLPGSHGTVGYVDDMLP